MRRRIEKNAPCACCQGGSARSGAGVLRAVRTGKERPSGCRSPREKARDRTHPQTRSRRPLRAARGVVAKHRRRINRPEGVEMKTHLYTAEWVACGEIPEHSPMIRDPAQVDCERCRRTKAFRRALEPGTKQEQTYPVEPGTKQEQTYKFEQQELF